MSWEAPKVITTAIPQPSLELPIAKDKVRLATMALPVRRSVVSYNVLCYHKPDVACLGNQKCNVEWQLTAVFFSSNLSHPYVVESLSIGSQADDKLSR